MTDEWMDEGRRYGRIHRKIVLLLHTLSLRRSDVASLIENTPIGVEEIA